jgi:hypothetical protein
MGVICRAKAVPSSSLDDAEDADETEELRARDGRELTVPFPSVLPSVLVRG